MATLDGQYAGTVLVTYNSQLTPGVHGGDITIPPGSIMPNAVRPTIIILDPPVGSALAPAARIKFRMLDDNGIRRALPAISYTDPANPTAPPRYEIIHDGEQFTADFKGTRTAITVGEQTGYEYDVKRSGGWQSAPTLVPFVFDTAGNEPA